MENGLGENDCTHCEDGNALTNEAGLCPEGSSRNFKVPLNTYCLGRKAEESTRGKEEKSLGEGL